MSCQKRDNLPVVATVTVTAVTTSTATAGGVVSDDGGSAITARGVCWTVEEEPKVTDSKTVDGAGTGTFSSSIVQLDQSKRYYVRAYATNIAGTAYGKQVKFVTQSNSGIIFNPAHTYDTVFGISGRAYKTINIGGRKGADGGFSPAKDGALGDWWMAENLNESCYNDGTEIPFVSDYAVWRYLTTPAYTYCLGANSNTYGALYNFYVISNTKNICPEGWHVPTFDNWVNLAEALGGEQVAGGKLKEEGYTHWLTPNTGATNSSGFTGLPGGYRDDNGMSYALGTLGDWWTAPYNTLAVYFQLHTSDNGITLKDTQALMEGYSVRCRKN